MSYAEEVANEVMEYLEGIDVNQDGEHLWSNYESVTAILTRLSAIHTKIAWLEIQGTADAELKKVRTLIVDKAVETFQDLSRYESRKLTARSIEFEMEKTSRLT